MYFKYNKLQISNKAMSLRDVVYNMSSKSAPPTPKSTVIWGYMMNMFHVS